MRGWRIENIEACEARLADLLDLRDDLELQLDEVLSEIDDLEYEIEQDNEAFYNEAKEDDDRQRAADMNATLRDIGGGF